MAVESEYGAWQLFLMPNVSPSRVDLRRGQNIGAGDPEYAIYHEGWRNHARHRNRVAVNRGVPDAASLDGIGAGKHLGGIGAGSDRGEQPVAEFVTGSVAEPPVDGSFAAGYPGKFAVVLGVIGNVVDRRVVVVVKSS